MEERLFQVQYLAPYQEDRLEGRKLDRYMLVYINCLTADLPTNLSSCLYIQGLSYIIYEPLNEKTVFRVSNHKLGSAALKDGYRLEISA